MKMGQSSAEKARKAINVAEIWSKVSHLLSTKKFWMELLVMTVGMFVASSAVHFLRFPANWSSGRSQDWPLWSISCFLSFL